jgi:hypothetical protein
MDFDRSNPLINYKLKERVEDFSQQIDMDWTTCTEINVGGTPIERQFSRLEFGDDIELSLGTGTPPGSLTNYDYYYKLTSEVAAHNYEGQLDWIDKSGMTADDLAGATGEVADLLAKENYRGWKYTVQLFHKIETWTDDIVGVKVWQLMSRPGSGSALLDRIITYDSKKKFVSVVDVPSADIQSFNVGTVWGIRTAATDNGFTFQMSKESGEVTKTFNRTAPCEIIPLPARGNPVSPYTILGGEPVLATDPVITMVAPAIDRPYLYNTIIDPITGVASEAPTVMPLAQVELWLYGKYFGKDLDYVKTYEEGWLVHPSDTSYTGRLKPPGQSGLSDDFNKVQTDFNPNTRWR